MSKRKNRAKEARRTFKIWFLVSQVLGVLGAILIGPVLDMGIQGYLIGYVIGVIFGLGVC
jgi:hypothetical protein